ncbi:MAG: mandelate racemase/muconate lactonizing enzyme family protein [Caldilineaceae bacterium]|nr:mandelate racemase/muconate lactonizing enzyme family protein [Caldilineaceae bacterium]
MKIEKITPFLVDRFLLVRVYTDAGIVGNGEAGLWAHHKMVYQAIEDLSAYYIGKDPRQIEHHYQVVSRDTHFMGAVISAAMSAIDMALWDILGKSVDLPVYQLLGGKCRDKVKVFANVTGNTPDEMAESARKQVAAGYLSLRTLPFFPNWEAQTPTQTISDAIAIVAAIREAVGDGIDLGVEIHRNLRPEQAIVLAGELAPYRLLFYEDPLAPESLEAMEYIARHINVPMATGERFYNIYQFKDLIDRKIVSLIRPDVSLAGGFTQVKKIAAMAEAAFVGIFPHLMGSPVNVAAFTHLDAAIPNYVLMESHTTTDVFNEIVDHPVERQGGYIVVSDRPGIGLEIDESKLARFPYRFKPIEGWFHADGSVAH